MRAFARGREKSHGGVSSQFYYMGGLGYLDEEDTQFAADQEIAEYDGTALLRRYVRLPGSVDEAFLMIDLTLPTNDNAPNAQERWAHMDRLGSVVAMSDTSGEVLEQYRYSPYGVPGWEGPAGFPFRFTGQKLDPETGLYYYKARYYDPETGRFLQIDPIGYEDQMNLYAYVGNDPINKFDPTGLCQVEDGEIVECDVVIDDDLTDDEREAAEAYIEEIVKVGEAIQENGSDDEKAAWEGVEEIRFTNDEYVDENGANPNVPATNTTSFERNRNGSAKKLQSAKIQFYKPAYGRSRTSGGGIDIPYIREIVGHEIWHGTVRNANAPNAEAHAVRASHRFLKRNGLQSRDYYPRGYRGFF